MHDHGTEVVADFLELGRTEPDTGFPTPRHRDLLLGVHVVHVPELDLPFRVLRLDRVRDHVVQCVVGNVCKVVAHRKRLLQHPFLDPLRAGRTGDVIGCRPQWPDQMLELVDRVVQYEVRPLRLVLHDAHPVHNLPDQVRVCVVRLCRRHQLIPDQWLNDLPEFVLDLLHQHLHRVRSNVVQFPAEVFEDDLAHRLPDVVELQERLR